MCHRLIRALAAALALGLLVPLGAEAAAPPSQPSKGPGSPLDPTGEVVKRAVGRASSVTFAYHLASEPKEPRTVVVFLHAWGAVNPLVYGGWIEHLARRGHLVLFPSFQTVGRTRPVDAPARAAELIKNALAALASDPQAKPDPSRLIYLGHTAGGPLGMNLAANAKALGLPAPKLVYMAMPGGAAKDEKSRGLQLGDLSAIPPETAIVAIVGDREFQAAERTARRIFREAAQVPANRKLFIRAFSDDHGFPALSATLASPASPKEGYDRAAIKVEPDPPPDPKARRAPQPRWSADMVLTGEQTVLVNQLPRNATDAMDWMAYWRTFDIVAAAALAGTDMETVRAEPGFVEMGRWADGWPVRRLSAEIPKTAEAAAPSAAPQAVSPIQSKQPVLRRQSKRPKR